MLHSGESCTLNYSIVEEAAVFFTTKIRSLLPPAIAQAAAARGAVYHGAYRGKGLWHYSLEV
jgi:hypothetical protein